MISVIPNIIIKFFEMIYYLIFGIIKQFFIIPVKTIVTKPLYTDESGRQYYPALMFLWFCLLTTFALSALLYGGAFFMIATVVYGWVVLFQKLKEFRKKNK